MHANRMSCTMWAIKALAVSPNHEKRTLQLTVTTDADSELAHDARVDGLSDIVQRLQDGELARVTLPNDAREFSLSLSAGDESIGPIDARRLGARLSVKETEDGAEVRLSVTYETDMNDKLLVWCARKLRDVVALTAKEKQLSLPGTQDQPAPSKRAGKQTESAETPAGAYR